MSTVDAGLLGYTHALKVGFAKRDKRVAEVHAVRKGDIDQVAPGAFSEEWPRMVVANMINAIARHAQAALSPLPTITCSSPTMTSDAQKKAAEKRTKIANSYYRDSNVGSQRQSAADQFYTYGLMVASVEPDFEAKRPVVVYEDSVGFYPVWDRFGRTKAVYREFRRRVIELKAEYPMLAERIERASIGIHGQGEDATVVVAKYDDAKRIVMFLPELGGIILEDMPNPMGRCTYVATKKPGLDAEQEGSFDDLIWVQVARHFMQMLALEAAADSVEAPIVVPNDVGDVPVGPGSIIRTQMGVNGVGRLKLDVPSAIWGSIEHLKNEMQYGAISPQALGGSIDASVVTGRGVQELMAGYSQQIAMAQDTILVHDEQVLGLCFEMDEKLWPDEEKRIAGRLDGEQYKITYKPSKDIAGDYSVDVIYGGVKGLDPNRGLVYLLQELGAGIVSKDYIRRTVDADINPTQEESKIALEQMRDTLIQAMSAYGQSMPGMAMQGQDPAEVVSKIVQVNRGLQKGESLEAIMEKVFPPPEPQPQQLPGSPPADAMAQAQGGGSPFEPTPGANATAGPGGRPDLQTLFAGLSSSGSPQLSGGVSRMQPAGG